MNPNDPTTSNQDDLDPFVERVDLDSVISILLARLVIARLSSDYIFDFWIDTGQTCGILDGFIYYGWRDGGIIVQFDKGVRSSDNETQLVDLLRQQFDILQKVKKYKSLPGNPISVLILLRGNQNPSYDKEVAFKKHIVQVKPGLAEHPLDFRDIFKSNPVQFIVKRGTKRTKFETFLRHFYIYNYDNVEEIEQRTREAFERNFLSEQAKGFLDFIDDWYKRDKSKYKLSKELVAAKVAQCIVSPFILFYPELEVCQNKDLFMKAIDHFRVTLINVAKAPKLGLLWNQNDMEKEIETLKMKFPIDGNVKGKSFLCHLLLWHFRGGHLAVSLRPSNAEIIAKALKLCMFSGRKFIFVTNVDDYVPGFVRSSDSFLNINDLTRKNAELAELFVNTLKVSLEGKEPFPLRDVFEDEAVKNCLTASHFLEMLTEEPLLIGKVDQLPEYYINRFLTSHMAKDGSLENMFPKETENISTYNVHSDNQSSENLDEKEERKRQRYGESSGGQHSERIDFSTIQRSRETEASPSQKRFKSSLNFSEMMNEVTIETNDGSLLGVSSARGMSDSEASAVSPKDGSINIICDAPGSGKSWFLKQLKYNQYPGELVIVIDARNFQFSAESHNDEKLQEFLLSEAFKPQNKLEAAILNVLYSKGRVVILWDSIDEVQSEKLAHIFHAIDFFKKHGLQQWLASRKELQASLENRFSVQSKTLRPISKDDQKQYIKQRLQLEEDTSLYKIVTKCIMRQMETNVVNAFVSGIPLQLFMLTELLRGPKSSQIMESLLSNKLFSIAALYDEFLNSKMTDGIHQENYEKAAMQVFFKPEHLQEYVNISCDQFLEDIQTHGDESGIITAVTTRVLSDEDVNKTPHFAHITFAEYLAARYLSKHPINSPIITAVPTNVRFFLDAITGQNSELHLAILYGDVEKVRRCKDLTGRNPLEFAESLRSTNFPKPVLGDSGLCSTYQQSLDDTMAILDESYRNRLEAYQNYNMLSRKLSSPKHTDKQESETKVEKPGETGTGAAVPVPIKLEPESNPTYQRKSIVLPVQNDHN